ncbi:MAG: 1-acyl-sn-glycerol-3-phosphate acyltransferase [Syntrophales bacterium]|nr:1-acyl-sn-glycerol-3-phosphate acyltransferase [Syntrophales bacterium]
MIRSAFIVSVAVAITGFFSACAVVYALLGAGENIIHKVARIWAKILLKIAGVQVTVSGTENVLLDRPQIFMSNHQSDFDILIVLAFIPGQFRWIAKKELFRIPVFGKAMRNAGYIEIDRQDHQRAMQSIEEAARKIREGKSVMSFPEGTRSRDGKVKAFKQGMFYLAIQAGVPIVPITIIGAGEIMPKRSLHVKPGRIAMIIDKPIETSAYTIEKRHDLIAKVRSIIVENLESRHGKP